MSHQSYPPPGGQPPPYHQPPYGGPPQPQPGKGMAVASLVLGILSILDPTIILGIFLGVIGVVLAVMAKKRGFLGGMATAGLVLSIIGIALNGFIFLLCGAAGMFAAIWADPWLDPWMW